MLDSDLAGMYGVATKVLIQAVKLNINRFPKDFMFQLVNKELTILRSQIATSSLRYHFGTLKNVGLQREIERRILIVRGKRVMMDRDLAELYNVSTKRLNEQVKRNSERFPEDFMFKLAKNEKDELVAKCDRFKLIYYSYSHIQQVPLYIPPLS